MGDCARVTVQITMNFDFCPLCCEIKICQKFCKSSPVTVLYMCKSDNETSTSMLDSRLEGQFSLSSFLLVIFSKDIYSTCDFIYAQCLDAVPSNKVQIYIIEKSKLCTTVCNICKEILNRAFADYLLHQCFVFEVTCFVQCDLNKLFQILGSWYRPPSLLSDSYRVLIHIASQLNSLFNLF